MMKAERSELRERIHRHDVEHDDVLEDAQEDIWEHDDVSEEEVWAKGFEEETMKGVMVAGSG